MSSIPPGWANTTVPLYAGVQCGNVDQDESYTTTGTTPEPIGFQSLSSWSDTQSLTSDDGFTWVCNTSGIYNLRCNQSLLVTNDYTPPDSSISVIPNTVFYLDLSGNLTAPQNGGNAILHPITTTQSSVSFSTDSIGADIEMVTFTTPANFLTSTTIPGGTWNLSLFADTDDETEANTAYISIYAVDDDGVSNPVLIQDGAGDTFLLNSTVPYNYNHSFSVPTYIADDLTKRIQFKLYANFGVASAINFYFRDTTLSSVSTTISQDVVPPTTDVVVVRVTVASATSELNQVFASSIPITLADIPAFTYNTSVNALANLYAGDTVDMTVASGLGNVIVTSESQVGGATNKFQWNLLAQGTYGNQTPVEAPMLMSVPEVPEVVVVPPMEFT
jgi:hypothetical protein